MYIGFMVPLSVFSSILPRCILNLWASIMNWLSRRTWYGSRTEGMLVGVVGWFGNPQVSLQLKESSYCFMSLRYCFARLARILTAPLSSIGLGVKGNVACSIKNSSACVQNLVSIALEFTSDGGL